MIKFITIKTMFYSTIITKIYFTCLGNQNFTIDTCCHFIMDWIETAQFALQRQCLVNRPLACSPGGILCIPLVGALLLRVLLTWLQRCFWELCSLKFVGYAICPHFFSGCLFLLHITTFLFYHWIIYIKSFIEY